MDAKKLIEYIVDIESKYPVDEWEYNGIRFWPIVRIHLVFELRKLFVKPGLEGNSKSKISLIKSVLNFIKIYFSDYKKNDLLSRRDAVILSDPQSRQFKIDNKWVDSFADPLNLLLKSQDMSFLSLEYSWGYDLRVPRYLKSHWVYFSFIKSSLISRLREKKIKLQISQSWYDFQKELEDRFPELNFNIIKNIDEQLAKYFSAAKNYEKILSRVQPKVAFVVCYYNFHSMSFILACHKMNIPVIELQHGLQGENNPTHSRWTKNPTQGWELLPDMFFSWSEKDANIINDWSSKLQKHKATPTGNLLLTFLEKQKNAWGVLESQSSHFFEKKVKNILIGLQPGFESKLHFFENIIKKNQNGINWWVRLHPSMLGDLKKYQDLFCQQKNVYVQEASQFPLYFLLPKMDGVMTLNSAILLDAMNFGVSVAVCDHSGKVFYEKEIEMGIVKYISSEEEFSEWQEIRTSGVPKNMNMNVITNNEFERLIKNVQR